MHITNSISYIPILWWLTWYIKMYGSPFTQNVIITWHQTYILYYTFVWLQWELDMIFSWINGKKFSFVFCVTHSSFFFKGQHFKWHAFHILLLWWVHTVICMLKHYDNLMNIPYDQPCFTGFVVPLFGFFKNFSLIN